MAASSRGGLEGDPTPAAGKPCPPIKIETPLGNPPFLTSQRCRSRASTRAFSLDGRGRKPRLWRRRKHEDLQMRATPPFRTIQVCSKDLRALPVHPEPAVSWHSGFRGGAPCWTSGDASSLRFSAVRRLHGRSRREHSSGNAFGASVCRMTAKCGQS